MNLPLKYGALCPSKPGAEIVLFVTEQPLEPGDYVLPGRRGPEAKVYIAESVPALIMSIHAEIESSQAAGQASLRLAHMNDDDAQRLAERLTDGLIRRLSEDNDIWEQEPGWLSRLQPAGGQTE